MFSVGETFICILIANFWKEPVHFQNLNSAQIIQLIISLPELMQLASLKNEIFFPALCQKPITFESLNQELTKH